MGSMPIPNHVRRRVGRAFSRWAIPAWIFTLFDRLWWLVEKGGDVDFLANFLPDAISFTREWGVFGGVIWLGFLLLRPPKADAHRNSPPQLDLRAMSDSEFRRCVMDLGARARAYLDAPEKQSEYYVEIQGDAVAVFDEAHKRGFMTDHERGQPGQAPSNQMTCNWLAVVSQNIAKKSGTVLAAEARSTPAVSHTEVSVKEQEAIERIRVLWFSEGKDASWSAFKLFDRIRGDLESHTSLTRFFQKPLDGLQASRDAMSKCVRNKSTATLTEVYQRFGEFSQQYMSVLPWFERVETDGIKVTREPYAKAHRQWQERHSKFRDGLLRIGNRSDSIELRECLRQYGVWLPDND